MNQLVSDRANPVTSNQTRHNLFNSYHIYPRKPYLSTAIYHPTIRASIFCPPHQER